MSPSPRSIEEIQNDVVSAPNGCNFLPYDTVIRPPLTVLIKVGTDYNAAHRTPLENLSYEGITGKRSSIPILPNHMPTGMSMCTYTLRQPDRRRAGSSSLANGVPFSFLITVSDLTGSSQSFPTKPAELFAFLGRQTTASKLLKFINVSRPAPDLSL